MKIIHTLIILIVFISISVVNAQETKETDSLLLDTPKAILKTVPLQRNFSLGILYTTNYIWRDVISNYAAIQPSATYQFGDSGFAVNFWSSYEASYNTNNLEISTTVSYNFLVAKSINITLGWVHYLAPIIKDNYGDDIIDTNFSELMFGVNFSNYFFKPSITNYISNEGVVYSTISVGSPELFLGNRPIQLNSSLGYRIGDIHTYNGFRDINFTISTPIHFKYANLFFFSSITHTIGNRTNYQLGINCVFKP